MKQLLIKNGTLVNPAGTQHGQCDILLADGVVQQIVASKDASFSNEEQMQVIDATNLIVAPGLVDVHVHFRDPGLTYKEDIITGSRAAAKGGYTSVVMMANTKPVIDQTSTLSYVLDKRKDNGNSCV